MNISILGNGAFAKEILSWISANHTNISPNNNISLIDDPNYIPPPNHALIIGIGNAQKRKAIYDTFPSHLFINVIHNSAIIYSKITSNGIIIAPNVIISNNSTIHNNVAINAASIIGHDNIINTHCQLNVNCNLAGYVTVGTASTINSGAIITPKITIGNNVTVGAGSVVLSNIDNDCTVFGNPARKMLVKN